MSNTSGKQEFNTTADGLLNGKVQSWSEKKNNVQIRRINFDEHGRIMRDSGTAEIILYKYDAQGNILSDKKNSYRLTYDSNGRVTEKAITSKATGEVRSVTFKYNGSGMLVRSSGDAFDVFAANDTEHKRFPVESLPNVVIDYKYDENQRLIRKTVSDIGGKLFYWEEYVYSPQGKLLKETANHIYQQKSADSSTAPFIGPDGTVTNPSSDYKLTDTLKRVISYQYDDQSRLNVKLAFNTSDNRWIKTSYAYDQSGKCIQEQRVDPYFDPQDEPEKEIVHPVTTKFIYDQQNNKTREEYYDQTSRLRNWIEWEYDKNAGLIARRAWNNYHNVDFCSEELFYDHQKNVVRKIEHDYWLGKDEIYDYTIDYYL